MIAFLVDQNFNEHIVDGMIRRDQTLVFTHVRDVGLASADDPAILEWAATQGLILLTHDGKTIPAFAYARIVAGQTMPGVSSSTTKCRSGRHRRVANCRSLSVCCRMQRRRQVLSALNGNDLACNFAI